MKKILSLFFGLMMLSSTAFAQIGLESLWNNVFDDSDNTIRVQLSGSGTVERITSDSIVSKAITADSIYSGVYLGALNISQNSDTVAISHDGTDAFMKWSDGYLRLETDEGTNSNTVVCQKGKGTGTATYLLQDGVSVNRSMGLKMAVNNAEIYFGTAVSSFVINEPGYDVDFRVKSDTITHAIALDAGTNAVTLSAPNSATTPAANATLSFWIDETGHALKVAVKYADGTAKTATVAFD